MVLPCWSEVTVFYAELYILSCLLQVLAAGLVCVRLQLFTKQRAANFFLGGACVPLIQFLYAFLLFSLPLRLPKLLYILPLPLCALVVIALACKELLAYLRKNPPTALVGRTFRISPKALCAVGLVLAVAIVWCAMLPFLKRLSTQNFSVDNDNAEYMTKATILANGQEIRPFLSLQDEPDGHFLADDHFPTWPVYLAYALLHAPEAAGYPYDMTGQVAYFACICYLSASYCGVLLLLCKKNPQWAAVGALLFFLVPYMGYPMLWASARDGFRTLAMLLLLAYLLKLTSAEELAAKPRRNMICVTLLAFFLGASHVVGIMPCAILLFAWLLALLLRRDPAITRRALALAAGGLCGALVGDYRSVISILFYKSLFLPKYPPLPAWTEPYTASTPPVFTPQEKFREMFLTEGSPVFLCESIIILAAFALTLVYFSRAKRARSAPLEKQLYPDMQRLLFLCAGFWFMWLPLSGILDGIYAFSSWFAVHARYVLHWRVLGAIIATYSLAVAEEALSGKRWRARFCKALSVGLAAVLFVLVLAPKGVGFTAPAKNLLYYASAVSKRNRHDSALQTYERPLLELPAFVGERKIVVTRRSHLYPYNGAAYFIRTRAMQPLMDAGTVDAARAALQSLSVGAIITDEAGWDDSFYPYTALGIYLESSPDVVRLDLPEPSDIRIYYISDPASPSQSPVAGLH